MRYLICLMLVVSTSLHAGAIHKWVDENGNVHYGDTPPIKVKTENISVQSAPSKPGKAQPRTSTEQASGAEDAGDDGSAAPDNVSDEQAQSICESARNDLNIINTNNNIQLRKADGSSRYLSADEVEERRVSSQAQIDRYCN